MGTRSRIGIQLKDDSILSIYQHWDGYPEWTGRILNSHYTDKEKVAELIDGGDCSCIWTKDRWTGKELAPYVTEQKNLKSMVLSITLDAVKIALLALIKTWKISWKMVKSMVMFTLAQEGLATILAPGMIHISSVSTSLRDI